MAMTNFYGSFFYSYFFSGMVMVVDVAVATIMDYVTTTTAVVVLKTTN